MSKPSDEAAAVSSPRHVLPKDLANAIKYLGDEELDRLIAATFAEIRRRGRRLPSDKPTPEMARDLPYYGLFDPWTVERRSSRVQGGYYAYAHRSPVRLIPIGRA